MQNFFIFFLIVFRALKKEVAKDDQSEKGKGKNK